MLWSGLITSKISQLGAAPILGHSVNGAVTGLDADAVPATAPTSVTAMAAPAQSARRRHVLNIPTLFLPNIFPSTPMTDDVLPLQVWQHTSQLKIFCVITES